MRAVKTLGLAALLLPAWAQAAPADDAAPAQVTPQTRTAPAANTDWSVGVSVFGLANGSFFTEPSLADKEGLIYPGFGGAGGGGGLDVHVAFRHFVGLDVGFYISSDRGEGAVNELDFTIGQSAVHIPLRLRLQVPTQSIARPYLFGGVDITVPLGDAEVSDMDSLLETAVKRGDAPQLGAQADTYVAWTVGLGFDFLLPIEGYDFRIPLTLRANLNPVGAKAKDRMIEPISQEHYVFSSEWQVQAVATLGFAWYFL